MDHQQEEEKGTPPHTISFLQNKTKGEIIHFINKLETCTLTELAQAWRSRSLNNYSINFLEEDTPSTTVHYMLDALDRVTHVETRHRSKPAHTRGQRPTGKDGKNFVKKNHLL